MHKFVILGSVCALLMGVTALAGGHETRLRGRLFAAPGQKRNAEGRAKFESRADRSRLGVEAQGTTNASMGGRVRIEIGDFSAVVAFDPIARNFDLNLDSRDGDSVPTLEPGDLVEVFDDVTGALLLSGTVAPK